MLDSVLTDVRYALRQLRLAPTCATRSSVLDCAERAHDALERVESVLESGVVVDVLEPLEEARTLLAGTGLAAAEGEERGSWTAEGGAA